MSVRASHPCSFARNTLESENHGVSILFSPTVFSNIVTGAELHIVVGPN
jgi:hypothetical protein